MQPYDVINTTFNFLINDKTIAVSTFLITFFSFRLMLRDRRYNKKAEKKRIQEIRDTVYIICEQVKDSDYCKGDLEGDLLITKAYVEFALKYSQSIRLIRVLQLCLMNINYIEEHRDPREVDGFKKVVSDLLGGLERRNIY
ncbi:hypothetical protein [Limosilactobacillus ingluviei]|uniref:hypothetical protein n=1 Tax=Limosilactobacillus ingluviei TaxID=148604 RepID=UPI0024BA486B|nr:hypothetical protein [Limosilactobacillus ingluviei]